MEKMLIFSRNDSIENGSFIYLIYEDSILLLNHPKS
jgi:hypothetical protein